LELSHVDSTMISKYQAWTLMDSIAALLFVGLLIMETVADQQQWVFQEEKWRLIKSGKKLEELPVPYRYGFVTTGLFRFSRHPNFFAEFSQWWAFYLFSVGASGVAYNWTVVGAILLTLLFQGSTAFTEYITAQKYPLYTIYQKHVTALVPFIPMESFAKLIELESKKDE
ncbi:hypothetical protein HDU76_005857, partial [Blyttiomyces sp. JEL0837]